MPQLRSLALTACAVCGLLLAQPAAHATKLIFNPNGGDGALVDQNYGDRVTSTVQGGYNYGADAGFTPNVVVDYLAVGDIKTWSSGGGTYGDLPDVIFSNARGVVNVQLTADPGYEVVLDSFDLAGWPQQDKTINSVEVLDSTNTALFAQNHVLVHGAGPSHTAFTFGPPLESSVLTVSFDATNLGADSANVGLDNLVFGQQPIVPEPSSMALLVGGALPLLRRLRRRKPAA
jgi:hypothetical protein